MPAFWVVPSSSTTPMESCSLLRLAPPRSCTSRTGELLRLSQALAAGPALRHRCTISTSFAPLTGSSPGTGRLLSVAERSSVSVTQRRFMSIQTSFTGTGAVRCTKRSSPGKWREFRFCAKRLNKRSQPERLPGWPSRKLNIADFARTNEPQFSRHTQRPRAQPQEHRFEIPRDSSLVLPVFRAQASTLALMFFSTKDSAAIWNSERLFTRVSSGSRGAPRIVEAIYGHISKARTVAIEQRTHRAAHEHCCHPLTEIYHFLRLLYVKLGTQVLRVAGGGLACTIELASSGVYCRSACTRLQGKRIALLARWCRQKGLR